MKSPAVQELPPGPVSGPVQPRPDRGVLKAVKQAALTVPVLPITIVVFVLLALVVPGFGSWPNIQNLLGSMAVLVIAAIGATIVFLVAGIDLSVGSTIALSSVCAAIVTRDTGSMALGLFTALAVGLAIGLVNGICIGYAGLQPFVLTLGVLLAARALAYIAAAAAAGSGGTAASVGRLPREVLQFGMSTLAGVPVVWWVAVLLVAVAALLLARTSTGRGLYLLGSNERAATFNGFSAPAVKTLAYSVAGLLGGFAGFILMTRLGSGNATAGDTLLLQVIAATVIGGTSLFGGIGGVWRTLVGVFLIVGLTNALGLVGWPSWNQEIVIGAVVIFGSGFAVYLNRFRGRR